MTVSVRIHGLTRRFGSGPPAVDCVELATEPGMCTVIAGPSGCGKTTLLRMIAGLERPDSGTIHFNARCVDALPAHERDLAMITQDAALYEHMTIRGNLDFPLRTRGVPRNDRRRLVDEIAARLRMEHMLDRRPDTLSGGERRRAALGRMLIVQPALLLMDEPLANLDPVTRRHFRTELRDIVSELGTSMLWITHDHEEAMAMGQSLVVMNNGRVRQSADPLEVYARPADAFVASFIGAPPMNLLPVGTEHSDADQTIIIRHGAGPHAWRITLPADRLPPHRDAHTTQRLLMGIRPHHLRRTTSAPSSCVTICADLVATEPMGSVQDLLFRTPAGDLLCVREPADTPLPAPGSVTLTCDPTLIHLFPVTTA